MMVRITSAGQTTARSTSGAGCLGCPLQKYVPTLRGAYHLCAGMPTPCEIPNIDLRPDWCPLRVSIVVIGEELPRAPEPTP